MTRDEIKTLMNAILAKQGKPSVTDENGVLRDLGFRSLDFSELALRVERAVGDELNFDAALMRSISTVADVLNFFEKTIQSARAGQI
jgi:acyl carrier protein|uniref:acyl carrier protein n=1 Tax=Prosthecobacter sp. TaxID=1965333 RepID=UPI0037847EB3